MTKSEIDRQYYQKNREKILETVKNYRLEHKTEIKARKIEDYLKHKESRRQQAAFEYTFRRDLLHALKSRPCMDCKIQYNPWQMQFDHRPNEVKLFCLGNISRVSAKAFYNELIKCDLVCGNCHAERTYRRLHA
jgi:hypothetical protein